MLKRDRTRNQTRNSMPVLADDKTKDAIQVVLNIRVLKALRAIQILQGLGLEGKIKVKPIKKNQ